MSLSTDRLPVFSHFRRWPSFALLTAAAALVGCLISARPIFAQTNSPIWYDTDTHGLWSNAALWGGQNDPNTGGNDTSPTLTGPPTIANDAVFNGTNFQASGTVVELNAAAAALGVYAPQVGSTSIFSSSSTTENLTIGSDGINLESTSATSNTPALTATSFALTIGESSLPINVVLAGSQTWTNNSPYSMELGETLNLPATSGASTLTLTSNDNAPTANNHILGIVSDTSADPLSIDVTGGLWSFNGANTYHGNVTVGTGVATAYAEMRLFTATSGGNGSINVMSGGTIGLVDTTSTAVTYANPISISGVGYQLGGTIPLNGAIFSTNTSAAAGTKANTLTGLVTLTGNATIQAQFSPLIISTGGVSLGSNTATLDSDATAQSITISGAITDAGALTPGSIIANAPGLVTLSGNNTFYGSTMVNSGTLALSTAGNNNIPNSALIAIGTGATFDVSGVTGSGAFGLTSGQTLSGEGAVKGVLTVNANSHLDPGGPPGTIGTLSTAQVTLKPGAILDYEFGSSSNDFLDLTTGNLVIGTSPATNDIAVNLFQQGNPSAAFDTPGTYDLIGYSASITGEGLPALFVGNPQPGFSYTFGLDAANNNDVDLTIAAVPEPTSLALLAIGGFGLAAWSIRRRRHRTAC